MKKRFALLLSLAMLAGTCFAGCGGGGGVEIDPNRTQLYVANFDGGVGSEWLDKIQVAFEAKYAQTEFEPGKKGVQLITDKSKSDHISAISTEIYNVIITENVSYNELAATGKILDITDIVQAKNLDGKTIESKLSAQQQGALTAVNGKYYALPHYEYYPGLTYDKDVFNDESLYIKEGGGYTNAEGNLSVGPDGQKNTFDDGLPATYEEFFKLCDQMGKKGVTPFIYTGQHPSYVDMLLEGLTAAYLGADEFELLFSFDSSRNGTLSGDKLITTEVVTGWSNDVPTIERVAITPQTGYLTSNIAAKYHALDFVETIVENKDDYLSDKINSALSHLDAQEEYIYSSLDGEPIAMLIEGSYWYHEASSAFERSVESYGNAAKTRNFAWMPLPNAINGAAGENGQKDVFLVDEANSYVVINANIKGDANLVKLAKLFVQYLYTDANLQEFTTTTGVYKGVTYELTQEQYNAQNTYYKSITDLRGDGSKVVRPISNNKIYVNAQNSFKFMHGEAFGSTVNGEPYAIAMNAIKKGVSAKDYFNGMSITENQWTSLYSKYF